MAKCVKRSNGSYTYHQSNEDNPIMGQMASVTTNPHQGPQIGLCGYVELGLYKCGTAVCVLEDKLVVCRTC